MKRWFVQKKVRSETDVLGEAGDGNSSHVRHHTRMDWRLFWEASPETVTFPAGCGELSYLLSGVLWKKQDTVPDVELI